MAIVTTSILILYSNIHASVDYFVEIFGNYSTVFILHNYCTDDVTAYSMYYVSFLCTLINFVRFVSAYCLLAR